MHRSLIPPSLFLFSISTRGWHPLIAGRQDKFCDRPLIDKNGNFLKCLSLVTERDTQKQTHTYVDVKTGSTVSRDHGSEKGVEVEEEELKKQVCNNTTLEEKELMQEAIDGNEKEVMRDIFSDGDADDSSMMICVPLEASDLRIEKRDCGSISGNTSIL